MMKKTGMTSLILVSLFAVGEATLGAATMTLDGTVSDAMCGGKHPIKDAAACTKSCVKKGSEYALAVGDKVYTLKTSDAKAKAELDNLAGKMAKVTGDVTGNTVMVTSVMMGAAKK